MSNLTVINAKREVDPILLRQLELTLELVKEGEVSGIAIALTFHSGATGSGYYAPNIALMLGAMELLKEEMFNPSPYSE